MSQKLSAMKYIKNNKRRVSVLVVSLSLCFVLFYLSNFLLSCTTETFQQLLIGNALKAQYVSLPYNAFGLDGVALEELGEKEFLRQAHEKERKLVEELKDIKGVEHVFYVPVNYVEISAVVGQYYVEIPMVQQEEVSVVMEHFGATLVEGKMPENSNEVLLDDKLMKNGSYQIGDSLKDYPEIKIVGVIQSDYYFGCGMYEDEKNLYYDNTIVILSDGSIEDVAVVLHDMGYEFKDEDAGIVDVKTGREDLQRDIIDAISGSSGMVYVVIIAVLSLALLIVYVTYLRDRRNEWCLYCSIGFSRTSIYASVMRELLFTFGLALLIGGLVVGASVVILDHTMIQSLGLKCRYFYGETLVEILCSFALILGLLQIPIRVALYKIRTIDAMDDELNG